MPSFVVLHLAGWALSTTLLLWSLGSWPKEAKRYSSRARAAVLTPFSRRWEQVVDPAHVSAFRVFRRRLGGTALVILVFALSYEIYCRIGE
jgi:hypothetical protein